MSNTLDYRVESTQNDQTPDEITPKISPRFLDKDSSKRVETLNTENEQYLVLSEPNLHTRHNQVDDENN